MVMKYIYLMVKHMQMNKGNTILEFICVLLIISSIIISSPIISKNEYLLHHILNEITNTQISAIIKNERICYDHEFIQHDYPICFNANGNVNRAQTVQFLQNSSNKKIIIQLGLGKHHIR